MELTKGMLELAAAKANHEQLRVMHEAVKAERDALAARVEGLTKVNSKLSQLENQQGKINQLEAALDCLQFAALLSCEGNDNLKRVLLDTLKIHNGAPDEFVDLLAGGAS